MLGFGEKRVHYQVWIVYVGKLQSNIWKIVLSRMESFPIYVGQLLDFKDAFLQCAVL